MQEMLSGVFQSLASWPEKGDEILSGRTSLWSVGVEELAGHGRKSLPLHGVVHIIPAMKINVRMLASLCFLPYPLIRVRRLSMNVECAAVTGYGASRGLLSSFGNIDQNLEQIHPEDWDIRHHTLPDFF